MRTKNFYFMIWLFSFLFMTTSSPKTGGCIELNTISKNNSLKIVQIDSIITADVIQITWYLSASNAPMELEVERSQNRIDFQKIDQIRRSVLDSQVVKYTYYDFKPPATRYFYRLKSTNEKFEAQYSQPISINAINLKKSIFEQNISTIRDAVDSFGFNIQKSDKVNLSVFDMFGQLVKNLIDDVIETGHYRISWDGLDNLGLVVPGGTYVYQIMIGQQTETRRIELIR
ncbi:T9SS type A sorting domain-containing protein [candidate division KSB1 bacterium]|nr:T9SS type A sorting domain-containing protein [candidate division KSB1 bacterium]